jgi:hypothetical protein
MTLLLGNPIKVGKYLPIGNMHVFNLRRPPIHCISAGTGTMAEKSEKAKYRLRNAREAERHIP